MRHLDAPGITLQILLNGYNQISKCAILQTYSRFTYEKRKRNKCTTFTKFYLNKNNVVKIWIFVFIIFHLQKNKINVLKV